MPKAKIYTKEDILRSMKFTKSIRAASRYLGCSYQHVKKYFKLYRVDDNDPNSPTLFEAHYNQHGKGINKFLSNKGKYPDLQKLFNGEIDPDSFEPSKIRDKMILEGYLAEQCDICGFKERRVVDYKIPLLVHFKNGNKRFWRPDNVRLLCYNHYFIMVGNVYSDKQIQGLEDYKPVPETQSVDWEMDDYFKEHFMELGLIEEPKDDIGQEFVSRK